MKRDLLATASTGLLVLAMLTAGASSVVWAGEGTAPFAPPAPLRLNSAEPLPFVDVTGSIRPAGQVQEAAVHRDTPAGFAPTEAARDLVLPPPDLPPPAVVDGATAAGVPLPGGTPPGATAPVAPPAMAVPASTIDAAAVGAALPAFQAGDGRRAGETAGQYRQRLKDRGVIATFYGEHGNKPLWIEGDHLAPAGRAVLMRIDRAGEDGLSLGATSVPTLSDRSPAGLVALELAVSEAAVSYAKQATGSRINPLTIDPLITAKPQVADPADVLGYLSTASDPSAALESYNPPQPGYLALRQKLAELRQNTAPAAAHETIPTGRTLKLGMRDPRVPLIRSRFGLDLPSAVADAGLVYDTKVAAAVADFQRSAGLPASGALTPRTIEALAGGDPGRLEAEIVANMERWRWMPRDLGENHISVNIPDYSLAVWHGDAVVHRARVVVGKPDHQTPVFSDLMRFIIVNPYWNVPLSIITKEMMPKLAADPNYFANHGYEVVEKNGVTVVRQPPGEDNALGRIKFMFPNQHAVYLHDTNARALFGKTKRAFSHGCVRVDQPFKLAEVVLGPDSGWSEKRVQKLVGGAERTINLPAPMPIHIGYFTAFVDEGGSLELRDDIYGYSAKVRAALGLKG